MIGSVITERRYPWLEGWMQYFRTRSRMYWIAAGLLLLYIYLIMLPLAAIVVGSFTAQGSTFFGPVQLEGWGRMLARTRGVFVTTIIYAIGLATLTTFLAAGLSWAIARTNVPFARGFYFLTFLGFFFPPVAWELVWIRLLGRRGIYATLLGFESLGVHSVPGMIFVSAIRWFPLGMILLVPLFASMDKTMEEAGRTSGASTLQTAKDITIPIVRPGIFAVFLLLFIIALGDFRVPLLLGAPEGIFVLSITIYNAVAIAPPQWGIAMTQSVLLVGIALPCLYLYKRSLGSTKKFATISGRGYQQNPNDIGRWRWVLFGLLVVFFLITMLIPLAVLIYMSLLPFYVPPQQLTDFGVFSLAAYSDVLENTRLLGSLVNSTIVAFVAASLLIVGAVANSWIVQKTDVPFREKLDYVSFSVIGIPPIPLAIGLTFVYLMFVPAGSWIYNSLLILVIAMYTRFIAGQVRIMEPGVIQIHQDLLEAGRMAGDSISSRLRNIVLPLIKQHAQAAWAMRFAVIFLELPIVAVLATRNTEMVAMALLITMEEGGFSEIAAFGVVVMIFLGAVTWAVHRI